MVNRRVLFLGLLAVPGVLLGPPVARGQESRTADLRPLKVAPGRPVKFVHDVEEVMTTNPDAKSPAKPLVCTFRRRTEFSVEVKEATGDGGFLGTVRFGRITGFVESPEIPAMEFDSSKPGKLDGVRTMMMVLPHAALGDMEFGLVFDFTGAVTGTRGLKEAIEGRAKAMGLDRANRMVLQVSLKEDHVTDLLRGLVLPAPLLLFDHKPGSSYPSIQMVPGMARALNCLATMEFAVVRADAKSVELSGKGDLRPQPPPPGSEPMIAKGSKAVADFKVSCADGLPISGSLSGEFLATSAILPPPGMKRTVKASVLRVEEWPSVAEKKAAK